MKKFLTYSILVIVISLVSYIVYVLVTTDLIYYTKIEITYTNGEKEIRAYNYDSYNIHLIDGCISLPCYNCDICGVREYKVLVATHTLIKN